MARMGMATSSVRMWRFVKSSHSVGQFTSSGPGACGCHVNRSVTTFPLDAKNLMMPTRGFIQRSNSVFQSTTDYLSLFLPAALQRSLPKSGEVRC